jgi:uncharacterized membrane protein (UPF0182 family)
VATAKGVAMGTDLWDALQQLFRMPVGDHAQQVASQPPAPSPSPSPSAVSSPVESEVIKALLRAEEARQKGDWAGYAKFYRRALELARKKSAR